MLGNSDFGRVTRVGCVGSVGNGMVGDCSHDVL